MTVRSPLIAPRSGADAGAVARGSQAGVTSDLLLTTLSPASATPPPGLNYDWPTPAAPAVSITLRSWAVGYNPSLVGQDRIFGAPGQTHQYQWPVPSGYAFPPSLQSWTWSHNQNLVGQDRLYGAEGQAPSYDWPLPRPSAAGLSRNAQDGIATGFVNLLGAPKPAPQHQYDWPVPGGYLFPASLRAWASPINPNLPPPPAAPTAQHDWPLPIAPAFAVTLRTWTASYNRNLIGKDRLFGAPGETHPYDWPLPGRYADASTFYTSMRTWSAFYPQILRPRSRGYVID
jgi:hypothetical protein